MIILKIKTILTPPVLGAIPQEGEGGGVLPVTKNLTSHWQPEHTPWT